MLSPNGCGPMGMFLFTEPQKKTYNFQHPNHSGDLVSSFLSLKAPSAAGPCFIINEPDASGRFPSKAALQVNVHTYVNENCFYEFTNQNYRCCLALARCRTCSVRLITPFSGKSLGNPTVNLSDSPTFQNVFFFVF